MSFLINPFLRPAGTITELAWDTAWSTSGIYAYSNSDRTAGRLNSGGIAWYSARAGASYGRSSGKLYVEWTVDAAGADGVLLGLTDSADSMASTYLGNAASNETVAYQAARAAGPLTVRRNSFTTAGAARTSTLAAAGDVVGCAVDFTNKKAWWYLNGTCDTGDATTNTGGLAFTGTPTLIPAGSSGSNTTPRDQWTFRLYANYLYTPSGYTPWPAS
jgi:hypothetical protein